MPTTDRQIILWSEAILGRSLDAALSDALVAPPVSSGSGDDPPPPGKDGEKAKSDAELAARKEQQVVWNLPGITFGEALATLPAAVIVEGNIGAQITYDPPLDASVPPVGTMTISVSVPGNEAFKPVVRKPFVLTVGVRPLVVSVQSAQMAQEEKPPAMAYTAQSLAAGDAIAVTYEGVPDSTAAPKLDGYEVTPVVAFTSGSAANYQITLVPGRVVVTSSFGDMDAEITRLRHTILKLPDDRKMTAENTPLLDRLDDIKLKRDNREAEPAALAKALTELSKEVYEAAYVAVETITVELASGIARIEQDETIRLKATITPQFPTVTELKWSTDNPELVSVTEDGAVTRAPRSLLGGTAVVRATSTAREKMTGALAIEVVPKPESIAIDAPDRLFLDGEATLRAVVAPIDAGQTVTWSIAEKSGDFGARVDAATGVLKITAPQKKRGSTAKPKLGSVSVQAMSAARPEVIAVSQEIEVGGYPVANIFIEQTEKAPIQIGAELQFQARTTPDNADSDVVWTLNGGDIAELVRVDDTGTYSVAVIKLKKPGQVELIATAADGSKFEESRWIGAKVPLVSISISANPQTIELSERPILKAVFTPVEARYPVAWSSSNEKVLVVDRKTGKVTPVAGGTATVTATADKQSDSIELTITLSDNATLSGQEGLPVLNLLDVFAAKIGLNATSGGASAYKNYRETLRQSILAGGRAEAGGTTRTPIDVKSVRADLIELRNTNYVLEHADWLKFAKFDDGSANCRVVQCGAVTLSEMSFNDAHITVFDTKERLPIGASDDALMTSVLRANLPGFIGLHVTAYEKEDKTVQMKVFASNSEWTPPTQNIRAWAENWSKKWKNTWVKKQYDEFLDLVRSQLRSWFENKKPELIKSLKAEIARIKSNDGGSIA